MKYSDFHLYTIAHGKRFVDAAFRCAQSFTMKNPGLKFTIFVVGNLIPGLMYNINGENILIESIDYPKYFDAAVIAKKQYADLLMFKYADAPFLLQTDAKYIGQVDADSLCMCKLPFQYFIEDLEAWKFCAASDPKVEVNKREIDKKWFRRVRWKLYFNSGICFWRSEQSKYLFERYKLFVLDNIEKLSKISYADQTWMNIYMNDCFTNQPLSEIGYYWNFRGTVRHPRAYIWHAGGRDSTGIEALKKEFESWG